MDALIEFLIKWLQKNKTLFVIIFSITFSIFIWNGYLKNNTFLLILQVFLLSFGLTRFLIFIDIYSIILRFPIISDIIYVCHHETRRLYYEFISNKKTRLERLWEAEGEISENFVDPDDCDKDPLDYVYEYTQLEYYNKKSKKYLYKDLNPAFIRLSDINQYGFFFQKHPIVKRIYLLFLLFLVSLIILL